MRGSVTLTTKLLSMGAGFLIVALLSIGLTLWVTWRLEGGAAAVNEAGRLRMHMMRMVLARQLEAPERVQELAVKFDAGLELLRRGDPVRPLAVPWSEDTLRRFEGIREEWRELQRNWAQSPHVDDAAAVARADDFVHRVDGLVDAIEIQMARWTTGLHLFQLALMALAIVAAVVFMVVTYLLVINPLVQLQQALAHIRQGNLSTRLAVETADEFGQLSAGFNLMAHALQASRDELEGKVQDKTAHLQVKSERLSALYEASALASEATSLDALAQGFVRLVRRVAGADAAAVRWSDETNERYVLLVSDQLPRSLTDGEHCLHTGTCACGQPQASANLRVIPITPAATLELPLPHCRDAGFETLVAIPVQLQQRVLGEIDLFFKGKQEMPEGMRDLLEAMARHLAGAMESLRATALEREAAVGQERALIARELHDSIAQSLAFLKIQTQLLRDAVTREDQTARDRSISELDVGVRGCYADVRELLVHFRTRTSEEDIEAALRSTLSKFGHQTGITHALSMTGHGLPLAPDVQIQVLHMVQEALSNVRKHSHANHVDLRVQRHPAWRFEVVDNGTGFDPTSVPPDSLHVGLGIMRERAERIGASVRVDSSPGAGARVVIELPVTTHAPTSVPVSISFTGATVPADSSMSLPTP
ncbi:type IV pili methyl-accepting chemotaxis transducer N-terminal domain-containing protein [Ottowia thiooxydans]|uniref:type IV pili methyl-accepting chemotaxis transducer N-terminal domain-containing protein n=1 Tax=Ottowia thiooxydans TaxID=219182 RepID=UPI000424341A|nr:type IV pili methyl-accepting chemotaxis transducer N-terminal domain-containing protein [Ottowia thiooxydans]